MTTVPSPAILVTAALEQAVHSYLRGLHFAPVYLGDTVAFVEARGTAAGCEWLEPAEVDAINDLLARHLGDVESDPSQWGAWTDAYAWNLTPDDAPFAVEPFEPSDEDKTDWQAEMSRLALEDVEWEASMFGAQAALDAGLTPPDPIRPGDVGSPQHARQLAVAARLDSLLGVRSRPQADVTDEDVILATGCIG